MTEDRWADLERLARKCTEGDPWYTADDLQCQSIPHLIPQDRAFISAANPSTVLELIAAARAKEAGGMSALTEDGRMKPFCRACQAIPAHGYCNLKGCPMKVEAGLAGDEAEGVVHPKNPSPEKQGEEL